MIQPNELIERWQNVHRVLDAMPEHERQKHWDMSIWGRQTDCGTIACAAGHCGLDAWFRERGFKLDFLGRESRISNVPDFFGLEGTSRIFWDSTQRPVETVIDEVRRYGAELERIALLMAKPGLPNIGEPWPDQGGIYAGACIGRDDGPDYYLIVGPQHERSLTWNEAMDWAASLEVDDYRDFAMPLRREQTVQFDRVRALFQRAAYWSCEQRASNGYLAWLQDFYDGVQGYWSKYSKLPARVVRRLTIQ